MATTKKTTKKSSSQKGTLFGKPKSQVVKRPGALTAKAKRAGKSIPEYCKGKKTGRTAKQCNLAKTFRKMNKKRKSS